MQGLSKEIESALSVVIEGLNYKFKIDEIEPDKVKASMSSKLLSFKAAKELLLKWENSFNAPTKIKFNRYIESLIESGESSLKILRKALSSNIDYDKLEDHKHRLAIESKLIVLNSINELDALIIELKNQFESGNVILKSNEFDLGFAEKYANKEFYPLSNYYKDWHNEEEDAIVIDPKGSRGEIIILEGLKIQLPHPPRDKSKILFHDRPKKKQYWRRTPIPKGLTIDNKEVYIEYIYEEFRRRREGLWFMNNGKPVYLTGYQYYYLQWFKLLDDGIYPNYRECQRDLFYHTSAVIIDERCLGSIFLKSRRTGGTYIDLSITLNDGTGTQNIKCGLTSMTDMDSKRAFAKQTYAFRNLPFFFQPLVKGKVDSPTHLEFAAPSNSSKESKRKKDTSTEGYVNSTIDYEVNKENAYDGQALFRIILDESAKRGKMNMITAFQVLYPTLYQGGSVKGKAFFLSTMGKHDDGGIEFKTLYINSKVIDRQKSGFTATKLYSYFMPAQDNYEVCTDIYGVCHKEKPSKGTVNTFGNPIKKGSMELIKELYDDAKKQGDEALNTVQRNFPLNEALALRDKQESCVFNLTKLTDQFDYNDTILEHQLFVRGNFEWKNNVRFSSVEWYPDERGRFKVAWFPSVATGTLKLQNNVKMSRGVYFPQNDYGCIGLDCYGSYSIGTNRQSKGAAHGYSGTNFVGTPQESFFFEYLDKPPTQDIFNEDILKAAWFYGLPILAENNRRDFVRYIYLANCRSFSMNRPDKTIDQLHGDDKILGGVPMQSKDMLDSHENAIRTYIQKRVGQASDSLHREEGEMGIMPFNDTLTDWMKFDPTKRTAFDLTISSGLALIGCQREKYKPARKIRDPKRYVPLLRKFSNSGDIGELIK